MANYRIAYNHATKVALVQLAATAIPAGSNAIGTFEHADVEPAVKDLEFDVNHVIFQHVRDALYHVSAKTGLAVPGTLQFPENITDMAGIKVMANIVLPDVNVQVVQNAPGNPA
jgi:hypothetical protein